MLQVYFRKKNELQSKNVQAVPKYQFRYKSFKQERGKSEFEIIFKFQLWQYNLTKYWMDLIYK